MIFDFTLNGVKIKKDIPTDWDQVKFRHFTDFKYTDKGKLNVPHALTLFTDIDEEILPKVLVSNLDKFVKVTAFLEDDGPPLFKYPKKILNYEIRQDLEFEAFGQYSDIKEIVQGGKTGMDLIKEYPMLCAIYTTHPYDFKEAEKRVDEFNNAPVTEVLAVGNFLLMKLIALRTNTSKASLKHLTPLRRLKLALKGWRARLVFQVRYFILKKKLNIQ